ncbi:MAG TPA: hypothetical protein VGB85_12395 [Nannocystis sp.]|jgi:hypothetical protein
MHVKALFPFLALSLLAGACDAAIVSQANGDAPAPPAVEAEAVVDAEVAVVVAEEKAPPAGKTKVDVEIKPEALDLESITFMVKKSKVKDAAALEKKINNPKEKLNNVDIDGDGKVDKIVIVEVKKDDGVIVFELHAIPSKSKDKDAAIVLAYINFTPDKTTNVLIVKATYAPVVIGYDVIVYDYTVPIVVKNDVIVVSGGGGFYGWLYAVHRPAFYGVVVYDVAPPPVIIVEYGYHDHGCWPPGHCKHGKWKGGKHGKHGKWH